MKIVRLAVCAGCTIAATPFLISCGSTAALSPLPNAYNLRIDGGLVVTRSIAATTGGTITTPDGAVLTIPPGALPTARFVRAILIGEQGIAEGLLGPDSVLASFSCGYVRGHAPR